MSNSVSKGVREDIVFELVHDTAALEQQYKEWARNLMLETLQQHLRGFSVTATGSKVCKNNIRALTPFPHLKCVFIPNIRHIGG